MTNLDKMNELVGSKATKDQITSWAYMNRVTVCNLHLEKEFESMEKSVETWMDSSNYFGMDDEHEAWDKFLDAEYVE